MFKRILLSLGVILAVGGAGFVGTRALLSDSVTLTDVTFSTGTVDLQIARDDTGWEASSVGGFTITSAMFPGQTKSGYFWLKNVSDVVLNLTGQAYGNTGTVSTDNIIITISPVQDGSDLSAGTPTGPFTLTQWLASPIALPDNLANGGHLRYKMDITLDPSVTEQGSTNTFSFQFVGTQTP